MVALLVFHNSHFRDFGQKKTANVIKNAILWFTMIGHFRVSWASVSKRG